MPKVVATVALLLLLIGVAVTTLRQCHRSAVFDPDGEVVAEFHFSAVADTGSMEPTLNGGSLLWWRGIRYGDIQNGMILVATMDGVMVVKRVEQRGSRWYLIGDNRSATTRYFLDRSKVNGFVWQYMTNGKTFVWNGVEYVQND